MSAPSLDVTYDPAPQELVGTQDDAYVEPKPLVAEDDDVSSIVRQADRLVRERFAQVFDIERRMLESVRVTGPDGQFVKNDEGAYVEDWSRVTMSQMQQFIQAGSAEAFFASQQSIDAYAEAVLAKFAYDDDYDAAYIAQGSGTVAERTSRAKAATVDKRWAALFRSVVSKKAKDAVERLDAHVRRVERIYVECMRQEERGYRAVRQ